jgi:hypothetical protein
MADLINNNNYDSCKAPACKGAANIGIRVISYPSSIDNCNDINITWAIDNLPEGINPIPNNVVWSFNDQGFSNISPSKTNVQNYYTNFAAPEGPGVLYLKVTANVNGQFYESDVCFLMVGSSSCSPSPTPVVSCEFDGDVESGNWVTFNKSYWIGTTESILFRYETYDIPDTMIIRNHETEEVLFTYGPGSTNGWAEEIIDTEGVEYIDINVTPNENTKTRWKFEISCYILPT